MDMSRYNSVERIKSYLVGELGQELVEKVLPIVIGFGDDILVLEQVGALKEKLKPYLREE
jgi:hypothetical protein